MFERILTKQNGKIRYTERMACFIVPGENLTSDHTHHSVSDLEVNWGAYRVLPASNLVSCESLWFRASMLSTKLSMLLVIGVCGLYLSGFYSGLV